MSTFMDASLLTKCRELLPHITFIEGELFYWSPQTNSVHVKAEALDTSDGRWSLLHEAAHAQLEHTYYTTDMGLLSLEVEAWQTAKQLAELYSIEIDENHIQDCLDTYRDWLYARSTCPACMLNSLQIDKTTYLCLNCSTRWTVSASRFCRPYRMHLRQTKTPSEANQTVFS
jgi:hypothetical protein